MNNDFANYYYDYIGATGTHTINDYIDYTSNNNFIYSSNSSNLLSFRIDNIDIETSNISSNISIDYYNKLDNKYKKLIEYKLESGTSNTYIYNSNVGGEIKFFIPVPYYDPIDNASGQPYRVKINPLGKLYLYYNYNIAISLTDTEGWYDVINLVMGTRASVNTQGLAIGVIQGQIAGITLSINQNNAVVQTALQTISKDINDNLRPCIANATENLAITNLTRLDLSKTQFANTITGNFESFLSRLGNNKYVSGGLGLTGAGGIIFSIAYGAIQNDHTAQIINNITDYQLNCNLNLSVSDKNDLSNLASNLLISNVLKYNCNLCNLCLFNGFINSNILTTQFIPELKSNKIMLGNITTPNIAYQMEMTGDLNLNMLYLNSTSLTSLLNQKQGNLTFNNPLLNTTNIITLKRDSSLTIDGSGNLSVVKTATTPIIITGNDFSLSYDSSLTKVGNNLSVVKTATTPIVITGNDFSLSYDSSLTKVGNNLSVVKTASLPLVITGNNWTLNYDSTLTLNGNNLSVAAGTSSKWAKRASALLDDIYNLNTRNVGIGTDQPGTKLDVNGGVSCRGDFTINYNANDNAYFSMINENQGALASVLFLFNTYSTSGRIELYNALHASTPNLLKISNSLGDIMITNGVTNPLIYLKRSNGNIGIGNANPSYKLHIEDGAVFIGDSSVGNGVQIDNGYKLIFDSSYTTNGTNKCNKIILHKNEAGIGYLAGFGIEAGGLAYSTWTDGRHKFYTGTTITSGGFLSFEIVKEQFNFYGNVDGSSGGFIRNASAGGSAHTYLGLLNNTGTFGGFFLNSSARTVDGGANNMTIRNDGGDLILSAKSSTPQIYLQESTDRIYMNGLVNIRQGSGGGSYVVPNNHMQDGSLTIGAINLNYGLGSALNNNTAGLMLECYDNTEIVVHDSGTRLTSLMAYQGGTSYNNITIGRDMGAGWGPAWNVNFAGAKISLANEWYILKGTTPTSVPNSLIFLHSTTNLTSRWWLNGTQDGTNSEISDERIKKEINDIDNPIEKLLLIKPKEYYLCSDKDYNKKYGIIAQDINKEESLKHLIYIDKEYIANLLTNAKFTKEKIGEEEVVLEYPEEKYIKSEENPTPYQRPKPKEIFKYTIITEKNLNELINIDDELKIVLDNDDINNIEIIIDDTPYNNRYKKRFIKVKEIIDDYSFEIYEDIDITEIEKDNLFIYGKKVDDFLKLDYQSLYCLNIKATQELIHKNQQLEKRIEKLEELINNFIINK